MKSKLLEMKQEFLFVQKLLASHNLSVEGFSDELFNELNDRVSNIYVLMNQGFCENVAICSTCVSHRDKLEKLVRKLDECEEEDSSCEEVVQLLVDFSLEIPDILEKMRETEAAF